MPLRRPSLPFLMGFVSLALLAGPALHAGPRAVPPERQTALDRYVAAPDATYGWTRVISMRDESATGYALELTSQTWRSAAEVDRPMWKHWLLVVKPDDLAHTTGLLFISGGNNRGTRPPAPGRELIQIAKDTRCVVAELRMVPNQPLVLDNDGVERVEDDFIAWTWDRFLRTGDALWPARLPMTKAAVRAMDAVTEFLASEDGGKVTVDRFVVAGGSKRGWTTWTTAIVDDRVVAICPIVIDVLNVEPSMLHHYQAYGFYAPAVGNYAEQHRIMDWLGTPEIEQLNRIEDPFAYLERLDLPKLLINATGDQFFLPDSSQFYFDRLPGVKYLRYVPNADHSLRNTDAYETLLAWQFVIANGRPFPRFEWTHGDGGVLTVTTEDRPEQVVLWCAHNPAVRDFRMEVAGPVFQSVPMESDAPSVFRARVPRPEGGWTAYFAELTYEVGAAAPLTVTTDVKVTPDTLPFPPPNPTRPKGFLSR